MSQAAIKLSLLLWWVGAASAAPLAPTFSTLSTAPYGPPEEYLSRVRPVIGSTVFDVTAYGAKGPLTPHCWVGVGGIARSWPCHQEAP